MTSRLMPSDEGVAPHPVHAQTPPWNEAERLAALRRYRVLDTEPEPAFDDITRIAALVCKAPIAVVNLVADTRQFFKAEVGLGVRESALDVSICAKAILQRGLFVVPDLRDNPLFACNPLVTGEPHLRFYAGALLETPEGLPIGTVCILDTQPRPDGLSAEQGEILLSLARQTMLLLELQRASQTSVDSEVRLRAILDTMPQIVWSTRPDGYHDYFNRRWYEFTGSTPEQSVGEGWNPTLHPDDRQRAFDAWSQALAAGDPYAIEYRLKPQDGDYRWFIGRALPVRNEQGEIERWFGTCTDVHDLKQAESASARLAAIVNASSDGIVSFDGVSGRIRSWNRGAEALFGYPADEAIGAPADLLLSPDRLTADENGTGVFDRVMRDGSARLDSMRRAKDGTLVAVDVTAERMDAPNGRVLGVSAIFRDMTQAKRAEAALRESEERRRIAAEAAQIGVWDYDPATGVLRWDEQTKALFGLPPEASVSYDVFLAGLHPEDREATHRAVQAALDPHGAGGYDLAYRTIGLADGVTRWIAARGRGYFEAGRAVRFIGTVLDITARKEAEAKLAETAERYRLAAQATNDAIWDWHLDTGQVIWNEALRTLFGHPQRETSAQWWKEHIHPDDRERVVASIASGMNGGGLRWQEEYRLQRADGTYAHVLDRGQVLRDPQHRPVRMIGALLDLTERRQSEETLRRYGVLVESMTEGVSLSDERGIIVYTNPAEDRMFGYAPGELVGQHVTVQNAYPPEENARRVAEVIARLQAQGSWEGEWRNRCKDGSEFLTASRITAVSVAGRPHWLCVQRDITDAKRAEERQALIQRELHHRVKNTLATVQAIAGSTLRSAESMEGFRTAFADRLISLGKTHTLITENAWEGASLRDLLRLELDPYDDGTGGRVRLIGPKVDLPADMAVALGMALHELTTNAVKYGALSAVGGYVLVDWTTQALAEGTRLYLTWSERNGPPVSRPSRRGFGSQLLQRALGAQVRGQVDVAYAPAGVEVTIEATLPQPGALAEHA